MRTYWPTNEWQEASPEVAGINAVQVAQIDKVIRAGFKNINSLMIVKNGVLALERYYHGCDPSQSHHVASVTKSVTSALIGIALAQGVISSVEQKVADFFPEYFLDERSPIKQALSIRHLLTMTTGLQWRTGARAFEPMMDRMRRSSNWIEFIARLPIQANKMGSFQYNSAASHLLSAIISKATGRCAREFANAHLFEPIGIQPIPASSIRDYYQEDVFGGSAIASWPEDPQGHTFGGWGLALPPRDMARFGLLCARGGQWGERCVISPQWLRESTQAYTQGYGGYGYQWWVRNMRGLAAFSAVGRGGQHLCCVPERDAVIVIISEMAGRWRERWPLIQEYLLPMIENNV
ncbi:possible beta-lactamase class C and other pencillin-binding protein [Candidatus Moduliflexus flocculans]|uniref:Possible beta-lactamase class C and other pencillin-binding protein n=1 Tax=Candidatus Moduliflexus flocculans TaxID=1499966 RepID=A0A0S6VYH6_9BACT|nr:possible beta-lactamase class C and other pencillin-binding protein [Candidatus Moduliflexus flocculans]